MTIRDMADCLDAKVLCGASRLDGAVSTACSSDLMSDVLAFVNDKTVLITGLCNTQVIRTAEMLDLHCLVFSRGKIPGDDVITQADELGIVVLATRLPSFSACGVLYERGMRGSPVTWENR